METYTKIGNWYRIPVMTVLKNCASCERFTLRTKFWWPPSYVFCSNFESTSNFKFILRALPRTSFHLESSVVLYWSLKHLLNKVTVREPRPRILPGADQLKSAGPNFASSRNEYGADGVCPYLLVVHLHHQLPALFRTGCNMRAVPRTDEKKRTSLAVISDSLSIMHSKCSLMQAKLSILKSGHSKFRTSGIFYRSHKATIRIRCSVGRSVIPVQLR